MANSMGAIDDLRAATVGHDAKRVRLRDLASAFVSAALGTAEARFRGYGQRAIWQHSSARTVAGLFCREPF